MFLQPKNGKKAGCRALPRGCPALSLYPGEKKWDDAGNLHQVRHAMNRYLLTALLVLVLLNGASPQEQLVNVKLRVLLVDKDLNQKPVPFQMVGFRDQAKASNSIELKTDLEGKAEKLLVPGRYAITTA
jgi:hypothetical protein